MMENFPLYSNDTGKAHNKRERAIRLAQFAPKMQV